jgi:hypothetical protein
MKLWNRFILWLGISQFDLSEDDNESEVENFRINERKDPNIWTKNKYKIH